MIDYATEHDYHVLLTVSREKEIIERRNIQNLVGMRVEGLLVCLSQETTARDIFRTVRKMNIPLVFFDRAFEDLGFSTVTFDDRTGAIDGVNRVIREGCTQIAHFAGYSTTNIGKRRIEGFTEALKNNGIPVRKEWIIEGGFDVQDGYESFRKLNRTGHRPEVIFTVNDRVALGAYKAAKEAGLRIPEDIGIFGYGFCETTDFFDPPLSVINQDPRRIAVEAIKLLIDEIDSSGKKTSRKRTMCIEEEFLWRRSVRGSTGAEDTGPSTF
jgi:LacI family transcriptional regulator